MKLVCTICARGGSKGVKNKNLRPLLGVPLIAHSITQARASKLFDAVVVSSDSEEILRAALEAGADHAVRRPDELATDTAPKLPVIRHCFQEAERLRGTRYDILVDLDATSPLRQPADITDAVRLLDDPAVSNVITAMHSRRSPYFNLVEVDTSGRVGLSKPLPKGIERRQDAPRSYDMNASIYVWRRESLFASDSLFQPGTRLYVMPEDRSIDIDSELDFDFVEFLAKKRGRL